MSFAAYDKLLSDLAPRCNVKDAKTLRKTKELIGLLNSKHSLSYSETCKVVVCLELASTLTSVDFAREVAVKLSGCGRRNYANAVNNVSKLLNLDKVYTIGEICLLVGASQIADTALKVFKKYRATSTLDAATLEHPMYACAAVLGVCKSQKIPCNATKLADISKVNKGNLKKLSQEFVKLCGIKSPEAIPEEKDKSEKPEEHKRKRQLRYEYSRDKKEDEGAEERYQDWKRRMLEED